MAKKHADPMPQADANGKLEDRFEMKIDLTDTRQQEVNDFLRSFKNKRSASDMVKRILYQHKTGLDWDTGRPLHTIYTPAPTPGLSVLAQEPEANKASPVIFNPDDLDALDEDLGDWGGKGG